MSEWLNQAIARAYSIQESAQESVRDGLSLKRQQSLQLLKSTPWPSRKTERWKYTPLRALEQLSLPKVAANNDTSVDAITNLDTLDVIFVDGKLQTDLNRELPQGLSIYSLSDSTQQATLNQLFSSIKPNHHLFGLVNDVLAKDGILIDVAAQAKIDKPVRVISIHNRGSEAHVRLLVNVGGSASVSIVEQVEGDDISLNTFFSEYQLAQQAQLNHYRLALQSQQAISLTGNHFRLDGRAQLNSSVIAYGSQLSRLDMDVVHCGENSEARLNGIYLLDNKELFDLHTNIEHTQPNGKTEEAVRGIVGGEGKAVFNGRIHIHPHAQKTDARLNNRNLLLSGRAEVDTKPELEIYADDVRCAHGATIAQMEERSLYYLQSRGIDRQQAQAMLTFGFINELLAQMPHREIGDWLRPKIRQRFDAAFQRQG